MVDELLRLMLDFVAYWGFARNSGLAWTALAEGRRCLHLAALMEDTACVSESSVQRLSRLHLSGLEWAEGHGMNFESIDTALTSTCECTELSSKLGVDVEVVEINTLAVML